MQAAEGMAGGEVRSGVKVALMLCCSTQCGPTNVQQPPFQMTLIIRHFLSDTLQRTRVLQHFPSNTFHPSQFTQQLPANTSANTLITAYLSSTLRGWEN
ncbi:hypothetical protein E2C01_087065 [Portunus trituberculatus]|uniref:Uncharacterized protein n=1 Tax=Portunus trituberculatus TaxID=210409 RepID=A0A5B7JF57_PORTR|nr:hypothetical protein [Portunus trituberculatus]